MDRLIAVSKVSKSFSSASQSSSQRLAAIWHVLRQRDDPAATQVLRDISLTVDRGASLGLIGANGAGKSTLLKLICGVLQPTTGSITTNGRIGALLELGAGFNPDFTGRENLQLAGALMGMSAAELKQAEPGILAFADIGHYVDEPVKHYSSGMVLRLGFALITAARPDILVTDEILGVGDESFQRKCQRWLDGYVDQGGTLLLVSHGMEQVRRLCKQAIWLEHGTVRQSGASDVVVDAYLACQEQRFERSQLVHEDDGVRYEIRRLALNNNSETVTLPSGSDLTVTVDLRSPDDRPPVVAIGIKDQHGTPIYGTTSEIDGAQPQRLERGKFRFDLTFLEVPLRPASYRLNAHAMDPEGLRLFDTVGCDFTITGETDATLGALRLNIVSN